MKINTQTKLKTLKGEEIKDAQVGEVIANILVSAKEGGKMKMFILAQKFATQDVVDIDSADLDLVRGAIEKQEPGYTNLITGQLLILIDELKSKKDDKPEVKN